MNLLYFLLPSCWTCHHHLKHSRYSDLNKCALNLRTDNTTGFAEEARQNEKKCGLRGSWFEEADYLHTLFS